MELCVGIENDCDGVAAFVSYARSKKLYFGSEYIYVCVCIYI